MTIPIHTGWTPAAVGCHWTRGDYSISTISQGDIRGYEVYRDRVCLASFVTWEAAEQLAERRFTDRRKSE